MAEYDAAVAAETIQVHARFEPTEGGSGCIECDVRFPTWGGYAGHVARKIDEALQ